MTLDAFKDPPRVSATCGSPCVFCIAGEAVYRTRRRIFGDVRSEIIPRDQAALEIMRGFTQMLVLIGLLFGCGEDLSVSRINYAFSSPRCPGMTDDLVEYSVDQVAGFFGDVERRFERPVYINERLDRAYSNNRGVGMPCESREKMCANLVHEWGHLFSLEMYGDPDKDHRRLAWFWDRWQGWPCLPNVAAENGFNL